MEENKNDNSFRTVVSNDENAYRSFQPINQSRQEKAPSAGFGKTVLLPFFCGVLGAGVVIRWLYRYSKYS